MGINGLRAPVEQNPNSVSPLGSSAEDPFLRRCAFSPLSHAWVCTTLGAIPRMNGRQNWTITTVLIRHPANPIITRHNIGKLPNSVTDVSSVFNPGAVHWNGRDVLLLRVQTRGRETVLCMAESDDGINFNIRPKRIRINGLGYIQERIYHLYDPRLTIIDDAVYIVLAADLDGACRLGIARTMDFESFEPIYFGQDHESRNGVLFPERVDGKFLMLERLNRVAVDGGVTSGSEIVLSESDDLRE